MFNLTYVDKQNNVSQTQLYSQDCWYLFQTTAPVDALSVLPPKTDMCRSHPVSRLITAFTRLTIQPMKSGKGGLGSDLYAVREAWASERDQGKIRNERSKAESCINLACMPFIVQLPLHWSYFFLMHPLEVHTLTLREGGKHNIVWSLQCYSFVN